MTTLKLIQDYLVRRPTEGGYIREVDGLRFIAIMAVVCQHLSERLLRFSNPVIEKDDLSFFVSRGTIGVFIFFAVSGFVLALPFVKSTPLTINRLKGFYFRRVERIEPPYLFWMTFFALVLVTKGAYSFSEILPHWLTSITYTHFLFFNDYSVINPVAWSLEIEIQFYLIAPFLATAYFSIKNKVQRRILILFLVMAFIVVQYQLGWLSFPMKATLLGRLPNFLIGFIIADFYVNEWNKGFTKSLIWDLVAIISFVAMCYTWTEELVKTFIFNILLLTFFISAFKGRLFSLFLSQKWIAITGGMCYTIYLIHLPLLEGFMRLTVPLATAFLPTHLSSHYGIHFVVQSLMILPVVFISSVIFFLLFEKPFMAKNWYKNVKKENLFMNIEKFKKIIAAFILLIATSISLKAQSDDSLQIKTLKLRPLSILTDLAIQNSPMLKANRSDVARQTLSWQVQKRSWADIVSVSGTGIYGNGSVLDANNNGSTTAYLLTDRKNVNVNLSVGFRISGGDILTRNKKAEIQNLQISRLHLEKEGIEQNIVEEVAVLYTQLELALKMVKLKADAVENHRMVLSIAEKFFKEGNYQATDYSTLLAKVTSAEEQYEQVKADAKRLILVLRNKVGDAVLEK